MNTELLYTILPTIITGIIGLVSAIWAYITGRKKRNLELNASINTAVVDLNDTIAKQSERISELYDEVLRLRKDLIASQTQNEQLLANQEKMKQELLDLRFKHQIRAPTRHKPDNYIQPCAAGSKTKSKRHKR